MSKKKILIIDDEADFCMLLKSYFSNKHYEVYYSYSLDTGMRLLEEIRPDILFLDNNLPDGSGWNSADEIMENYPQLQLNLISTHQNDFIKKETQLLRIWEKPLKLTELSKMF
jgi:two-component system OmpR family response regulator